MDYKRYRFRLDPENEKDRLVMEYIERDGRINSDEIGELLYKGLTTENVSRRASEVVDDKDENSARMEQLLLLIVQRIDDLESCLRECRTSSLSYKSVVRSEPEKQKKKLFSKNSPKEKVVYETQARQIEDYNGLLKYMVEKNMSKEVWNAVTNAVRYGIPDEEIISWVEDNMEAYQINEAVQITLHRREQEGKIQK